MNKNEDKETESLGGWFSTLGSPYCVGKAGSWETRGDAVGALAATDQTSDDGGSDWRLPWRPGNGSIQDRGTRERGA